MGGNSSYNKTLGRVKGSKRTHQEFYHRIDGHKIILQNKNKAQVKLPVNSNSESPIYLGARVRKDGSVEIATMGIYENHKCVAQIDLKFDKNGNLIPYSGNGEKSSHLHYFSENPETGIVSRISGQKSNHHPIDSRYESLIGKIVEFNKQHVI